MNEKLFRILALLLLAIIALGQFLPLEDPTPANGTQPASQACHTAISNAQLLVSAEGERMDALQDQYQSLVYTRASNINQQILYANEALFAAASLQLQLQHALLDVLASCD